MRHSSLGTSAAVFMFSLLAAGTIAAAVPMFSVTANAATTATGSDAELATDSDAEMKDGDIANDYTGWIEEDGKYSYFEDGKKFTGADEADGVFMTMIDGYLYAFDADGYALVNQLYTDKNGDVHFFSRKSSDSRGGHIGAAVRRRWRLVGGAWYYFDDDGYAVKGFFSVGYDGDVYVYYADPKTAELQFGWLEVDGEKYYAEPNSSDKNTDGHLVTGWKTMGGSRYYFQEGDAETDIPEYGKLLKTEKVPESKSSDHTNAIGGGSGSGGSGSGPNTGKGSSSHGWKADSGRWTYTAADGTQAKDTWVFDNGKWYSIGADGYMLTGLVTDPKDGHTYYLDPATGAMVTGTVTLNGVTYFFNPQPSERTYTQDADGFWHWNGSTALPLGALVK